MHIHKIFFYSAFLVVPYFINSMELYKITIQVVNEAGEPVYIEFEDPIRTSPEAYAKGEYPVNVMTKPGETNHSSMDANNESRYARTLAQMGRLDIINFSHSQKLSAKFLKDGTIVNIKPYLEKIFDKPGTKVVLLKKEFAKGLLGQKKLTVQTVVEQKTLSELNALAEGKVAQEPGFERAFGRAEGREKEEIISEESSQKTFENIKKDMMGKKDTLGAWGRLIAILYDDSKKLTAEEVYRELGLSKAPTAQEFFNPTLFGEKPDIKAAVVFHKLAPLFSPDKLRSEWNPIAHKKAALVYRMILEQSKKI
jgi:hypothetical protein